MNRRTANYRFRVLVLPLCLALLLQTLPLGAVISSPSSVPPGRESPSLVPWLALGPRLVHAQATPTTTLQLGKSAPASVNQGDLLQYLLYITNTTAITANVVDVTDTKPALTVYNPPADGGSGALNGGGATWFSGETIDGNAVEWFTADKVYTTSHGLPGNRTATLFMQVRVQSPITDGTIITNGTAAYGASAENAAPVSGGNATTTVVNAPHWSIGKTAPATVRPGDYLTYTLTVTNDGHLDTQGLYTITDAIPDPEHTNYINSTPLATLNGDLLTWTFPNTLTIGVSRVVSYVIQIDKPLTDGLTIQNTTYSVTGGNVYTGATGPAVDTIVRSAPSLTVTKTADPAPLVEAGGLLTYTLTVTNQADAEGPALNVVISDTLPADAVYREASFIPPATGTTSTLGGDVVQWSLANPLAEDQSAQVQVVVQAQSPLPNGTLLTNTYAVSASNAPAWVDGPPVTSVISSSSHIAGLSKSVWPASVAPGGAVTYTITLTNTGNATADAVTVADTFAAGFTPASYNVPGVVVPGRDLAGTPGTAQLNLVGVTVPITPGLYYNPAITVTNGSEQTTLTNSAPLTVTAPELHLAKVAARDVISAGESISYTLTYSNNSSTPASGVWLTDTLPAGVTFVGSVPPPATPAGNQMGWDLGTLGAHASGTLLITVSVPASMADNTILDNSAIITSAEGSGASAGPVTVTVRAPALHIAKTDSTDPVQAGGRLVYTLTYSNSGGAVAFNTRITDTLDGNTAFVDASPATSGGSNPVYYWGVGNLPPDGVDHTIVVTVDVTSPLTNGTLLANTALIAAAGQSAQATETTQVTSAPILHIQKTASSDLVHPGDLITYTIAYSNSGNEVAHDVHITDTIDGNTIFQGASPGYSGSYVWIIPSLPPSATTQVTLTVRVTDALPNSTLLTNDVVIQDATGVSATDQATATVQSAPDLHLSKTVSAAVIQPGDTLTYTIWYSNTGNSPASGVIITDTLPAYLSSGGSPTNWNVGAVPVGGPYSITLVVVAEDAIADLVELTNAVTMTSVETGPLTASVPVTVHAADLAVSKTAIGDPVLADGLITYTIAVANIGHATASNLRITDTLPISIVDSSVVSSASPDVVFDSFTPPNTYVWTAPTLDGGSVITVGLGGRVVTSPWPAAGTIFTNTVQATADQAEADLINNTFDRSATGRPGLPYAVTLSATPTSTTVGSSVAVTATVTDQWGNPAYNGQTVDFATSLGALPDGITQDGVATSILSSIVPGVATITGTINGHSDSLTVTFVTGAPDHFVFAPISSPQTAGVPFSISITAKDLFENTVLGYVAPVTLTDSTGTLIPTAVTSGWSDGVWTGSATITRTWSADVITADDGTINGASNSFDVWPGPPYAAEMTVTTPVSVCGSSSISAAVVDVYGNRVRANVPISFYVTTGGGGPMASLLGNPRFTDDSGVATTTLTWLSGTGLAAVGVDVNGDFIGNNYTALEDSKTVEFTSPGAPASIAIAADPTSVVAGGTSLVTVTLWDCGSNLVPNAGVSLALSGVGSVVPPSGLTDGSGVFTATFNAGAAPGSATITATYGALAPASVTINVTGGPVLAVTKVAEPPSGTAISAGQTITYVITVTNTGTAATGFVLTDVTPANASYVPSSASASGWAAVTSQDPLVVTAADFGAGQTLTATFAVAANGSGGVANYATIDSDQTAPQDSNTVSHPLASPASDNLFLPLILVNMDGSPPPQPPNVDLVVAAIRFVPSGPPASGALYNVEVDVQNVGTGTVASGFFVELYLNPSRTPVVGDSWQELSQSAGGPCIVGNELDPDCFGRAWQVPAGLGPGATWTLSTDPALFPTLSQYDNWPPGGAPYSSSHSPIIAFADSMGAVAETNESNNLSTQLIGTVLSADAIRSLLPAPILRPASSLPRPHPTLPPIGGD
jgi:uncharacterized repeat protein (TIGR01451 family)